MDSVIRRIESVLWKRISGQIQSHSEKELCKFNFIVCRLMESLMQTEKNPFNLSASVMGSWPSDSSCDPLLMGIRQCKDVHGTSLEVVEKIP